jgi:tetratricopeptide (TPR) repeat protein
MRDNFSQPVRERLAKRAGQCCSNPDCQKSTVGPGEDPNNTVDIGVAAHVTAASENGPRFDATATPKDRSSITNAIWLCQNCAKLIDSDVQRFTVTALLGWKKEGEERARQRLSELQPQENNRRTGDHSSDSMAASIAGDGSTVIQAKGKHITIHVPSNQSPSTSFQSQRRLSRKGTSFFIIASVIFILGILRFAPAAMLAVLPDRMSIAIEDFQKTCLTPPAKANPNRFTVLLAKLPNDRADESYDLVRDELTTFSNIEVKELGCSFEPDSTWTLSKRFFPYRADPNKLLEHTGAQVLVWGTVSRHANDVRPYVRTTTRNYDGWRIATEAKYKPSEENLDLPPLNAAVAKVIAAAIAGEYVRISRRDVTTISKLSDRLSEADKVIEDLVALRGRLANTLTKNESPDEFQLYINRATRALAVAYVYIGEHLGTRRQGDRAVALLEDRIKSLSPRSDTSEAVLLRSYLAWAHLSLGARFEEHKSLQRSIDEYGSLLKLPQMSGDATARARMYNNLGLALYIVADQRGNTETLLSAIGYFESALQVFTHAEYRLDWAHVRTNQINALMLASELTDDPAQKAQASIKLFVELGKVHEIRTKKERPKDWATTNHIAGRYLYLEGKRTGSLERTLEAIDTIEESAIELSGELTRIPWAATQNDLGLAYTLKSELQGTPSPLIEAIKSLKEAVSVYEEFQLRGPWAHANNNLGIAHTTVMSGATSVEDVGAHYRASLTSFEHAQRVWILAESRELWSMVESNIATLYLLFGARRNSVESFQKAIDGFKQVLDLRESTNRPLRWAAAKNNLAVALYEKGRADNSPALMAEAAKAAQDALAIRTQKEFPVLWAVTTANLGRALVKSGESEIDPDKITKGVTALAKASKQFELIGAVAHRNAVLADLQQAQTALNIISQKRSANFRSRF